MEKYKNVHGLLSFSIGGSDYISNKGDIIELPDSLYVQTLLNRGHIVIVNDLAEVPEEIITEDILPEIEETITPMDNLAEVPENLIPEDNFSVIPDEIIPADNILGISEEIISGDSQKELKKINKTTKK